MRYINQIDMRALLDAATKVADTSQATIEIRFMCPDARLMALEAVRDLAESVAVQVEPRAAVYDEDPPYVLETLSLTVGRVRFEPGSTRRAATQEEIDLLEREGVDMSGKDSRHASIRVAWGSDA